MIINIGYLLRDNRSNNNEMNFKMEEPTAIKGTATNIATKMATLG